MAASPVAGPASARVAARPAPLTISPWTAPLLVVGDFALLAAVPVALMLTGTSGTRACVTFADQLVSSARSVRPRPPSAC